jgi:hypothetical protein
MASNLNNLRNTIKSLGIDKSSIVKHQANFTSNSRMKAEIVSNLGSYWSPPTRTRRQRKYEKRPSRKTLPLNTATFNEVAKWGDLELMKWLRKKGCPWNTSVFVGAAIGGNLDAMKWLRKNGCPWNALTFEYACLNGSLDNIKWLHDNGCPWDKAAYIGATANYCTARTVIQYLDENGCPPYKGFVFL